ncbi:MAG: hypothetical protein ACFFF9_12355 [Candidatus Thorarchaeota archaeon]
MRIKAVLRDSEILQMEAGSDDRILATAKKNIDRVVNLPSLMKVMGLSMDDRCRMLDSFRNSDIHIWLLTEANQHLIYFNENREATFDGYQWQ